MATLEFFIFRSLILRIFWNSFICRNIKPNSQRSYGRWGGGRDTFAHAIKNIWRKLLDMFLNNDFRFLAQFLCSSFHCVLSHISSVAPGWIAHVTLVLDLMFLGTSLAFFSKKWSQFSLSELSASICWYLIVTLSFWNYGRGKRKCKWVQDIGTRPFG